jgi:hypothetical protein
MEVKIKMRQKVLIMRCDDYDPEKISGIIKEGMEELCIEPSGRILLKPKVLIPINIAYCRMRLNRFLNRFFDNLA